MVASFVIRFETKIKATLIKINGLKKNENCLKKEFYDLNYVVLLRRSYV
jgi:hypothetical protein